MIPTLLGAQEATRGISSRNALILIGRLDECFQEQKPSERYYCEHNERLAVYQDGYWETFRDGEAEKLQKKV